MGVQVKLWNPLTVRAIPERFCGGDALWRGAISSVCMYATYSYWSSNWLVPILWVLWVLHFSSFQLNPTHPSDHTHFSAIHLQFMLNFHRPGLTAMHQTTPHTSSIYLAFHCLTRILFQLEWVGIHKTFSKQIWLWLLLLNHILHLHPTYLLKTEFIYLFQRCLITNIQIDANQY